MKPMFFALALLGSLHGVAQSDTLRREARIPDSISPAEKVFGLSKIWQEVNYNYVFLDRVDRSAWDSLYLAYIDSVQRTANDYEYYHLLSRFMATLRDGHTGVFYPARLNDELYTTYFGKYRLIVENFEGRSYVTRINASMRDVLPPGTEVIRVNGLPEAEYRARYVKPFLSTSTDYILEEWSTSRMFQAPIGTPFDIVFRLPDGEVKALHLVHTECPEKEVYPPFPDPAGLFELRWYPGDCAYIALNSFNDPEINALFESHLKELGKAKSLIIDLRYNGGGSTNIGFDILQHFSDRELLEGSRSFTRQHLSCYKAWGLDMEAGDTVGDEWAKEAWLYGHDAYLHELEFAPDTVSPDAKQIVVPTVVLMGHGTGSAAEDFLIYADAMPHMTFVGERSNGSTGQPLFFELPGGGSARICTKHDTYANGKLFVGVGVVPDVEVPRTLADHLSGRDAALEEAFRILEVRVEKKKSGGTR